MAEMVDGRGSVMGNLGVQFSPFDLLPPTLNALGIPSPGDSPSAQPRCATIQRKA